MRKLFVLAISVLLFGTALGVTVLRTPVADAASSVLNIFVTNDASHPVPVREQNLDANGNVKTHEQGTADVNVANSNLAVTGTVSIDQTHNTVRVDMPGSNPASAFTVAPRQVTLGLQGDPSETPDPSGTRYAITSVVLTNPTDQSDEVRLEAVAFGVGTGGCSILANVAATAPGPDLIMGPHSTLVVNYPEPFITASVAGPMVCLGAFGSNAFVSETWSVVAYKL